MWINLVTVYITLRICISSPTQRYKSYHLTIEFHQNTLLLHTTQADALSEYRKHARSGINSLQNIMKKT